MKKKDRKILADCIRSLMLEETSNEPFRFKCRSCGAGAAHFFVDNDHEPYCRAMAAVRMLEGSEK